MELNVLDFLVEILLSGLLYFGQHWHRRQLFSQLKNHEYALTLPYTRITYELLPFIIDIDLDSWTTISLFDNLEEPKVM